MSKKPRADSPLDRMPQHQINALTEWLFDENISYAEARTRLAERYSVSTSSAALCSWRQRIAQQRLLQSIAERARKSNAVVERFEQNPSDTFRAVIGMVSQIAFDKSTQEDIDVDSLFSLTKLLLEEKKLGQKDIDQTLERQKFQRETCACFLQWFKDAKAREIAESNLSNTDKIERLRKAYFADVDALEQSGEVELPE